MTLRRLALAILACACASGSAADARASAPSGPASAPSIKTGPKLLSPSARRFLAPSMFAYWAGTERIRDGELAPAMPRPFEGHRLVPDFDDQTFTTAYLRVARAVMHRREDWRIVELGSLHEIHGGAVLATGFRVDEREQRAIDGMLTVTLPLKRRLWIVPTFSLGAGADTSPDALAGAEFRSDRTEPLGYTLGLEGSRWTRDRTRVLGKVGGLYRFGQASLEERLAVGAWSGPEVGGELAVHWISAALQTFGERFALYERLTVGRGLAATTDDKAPDKSALSFDFALGFRDALGPTYGFALQVDIGAQSGIYHRSGIDLTLYGMLF